jgi:hypothetical protein
MYWILDIRKQATHTERDSENIPRIHLHQANRNNHLNDKWNGICMLDGCLTNAGSLYPEWNTGFSYSPPKNPPDLGPSWGCIPRRFYVIIEFGILSDSSDSSITGKKLSIFSATSSFEQWVLFNLWKGILDIFDHITY